MTGTDCSVVVPNDYSGPVAIIGGSGSGKTECVVKQTLYRTYRDGNFFAIDLKGDLLSGYREVNPGEVVKVFSLRGETEFTYEPFDFIREDGEDNLVSNMRELVNALIPLPANVRDPFWIQSAREFLTGGLLYYYEKKPSFIEAVINIMTTPPTTLITIIGKCKNPMIRSFINNFLGDADLSDSKLLMGISQEITNRLSVIVNDSRVRTALSPSANQIQWTDLEICNIFLSVPEDRLEQYSPVIAMLNTQLVRSLERRHEKHSNEGRKQRQILVMLDEFPRLGRMDVIASAVSTLRSKNVVICLVFQSLAQLDAVYGRDVGRIILDNCSYMAVLSVNDVQSQKYFSERAGTHLVERRSRSTSYAPPTESSTVSDLLSRNAYKATGYTESVSVAREHLIQPHEFATQKDIILFTPSGHTRVKKAPFHEIDRITKFRDGVKKVIAEVKSFFSSCFGLIKRRVMGCS